MPITNDTVINATKAAAENRYFLANGTVGDVIPSNVTLNATANATANITNPLGCKLTVPDNFVVDPFVGEWCYFNGQMGFMFRGVRDPTGKLFLQRFRLKTHKSSIAPNVTVNATNTTNVNVTVNATIIAGPTAVAPAVNRTFMELFADVDAETETDPFAESEAEAATLDAFEAAFIETQTEAEADAEALAETDVTFGAEAEAEAELDAEADAEADAEMEDYTLEESFEVPETIFAELDTLLRFNSKPKKGKKVKAPKKPTIPKTSAVPPTKAKKAKKGKKAKKSVKAPKTPKGNKDGLPMFLAPTPPPKGTVPKFAPPKAPTAPKAPAPAAPAVAPPITTSLMESGENNIYLTQPQVSKILGTDTPLNDPSKSPYIQPPGGHPPPPAGRPFVLPPLPPRVFGQCAAKAAEYVDCSGGALIDTLNGTEARGFCADGQTSALSILELRDFTSKLEHFRRQLRKFAASSFNVADTKAVTNKFNKEEDHVRLCFLPGTYVEKRRYQVKGNFESTRLGEAHGFFKPTISIECSSKFCKKAKILSSDGPSNTFLNLAP